MQPHTYRSSRQRHSDAPYPHTLPSCHSRSSCWCPKSTDSHRSWLQGPTCCQIHSVSSRWPLCIVLSTRHSRKRSWCVFDGSHWGSSWCWLRAGWGWRRTGQGRRGLWGIRTLSKGGRLLWRLSIWSRVTGRLSWFWACLRWTGLLWGRWRIGSPHLGLGRPFWIWGRLTRCVSWIWRSLSRYWSPQFRLEKSS